MRSRFLPKLNYSNVIATIALFVAMGGAAVAAGLPKNSVGKKQLKRGAVTTAKLQRAAVKPGKLAPKAVIAGKIGAGAVLPGNIVDGGITTSKIGNGAVIARSIKNSVVTTNKLNGNAVTTEKLASGSVTNPILANGSVTPGKLSEDFGPLIATLKSGQTLRGVFSIGGPADGKAYESQSFQSPLLNTATAHVVDPQSATTAECPGITGGGGQTPQAAPGQLCFYVTSKADLGPLTAATAGTNRLGFVLEAEGLPGQAFYAYGQWAVTAP